MSLPPQVRRLLVKLTAASREAESGEAECGEAGVWRGGVWRGADEAEVHQLNFTSLSHVARTPEGRNLVFTPSQPGQLYQANRPAV